MVLAILALVLIVAGVFLVRREMKKQEANTDPENYYHRTSFHLAKKFLTPGVYRIAYTLMILLAFFLIASTSFVFIEENEVGHLNKIYGGKSLENGAIIAVNGEKGPQAEILPPGFHFRLALNIIYDVKKEEVVIVPEGKYGFLLAKDGRPLSPDQTFADAFDPEIGDKMVADAHYFITNGGQKGPQTSILTPGTYRLNKFLWDVEFDSAEEIPKGFVGVIKSNVWSRVDFGNLKTEKPTPKEIAAKKEQTGNRLAVILVPVGAIGVWDKALSPGKYYINKKAYAVTQIDTRVQAWEYKGGFKKRYINLVVDQEGEIKQEAGDIDVPIPKGAADEAVFVKVEGWDVPQELRVLVQVTPENAPFVVASVGGLAEVEDRILTPVIRSITRNVAGGSIHVDTPMVDKEGKIIVDEAGAPKTKLVTRPTRVLDLIENRDMLEINIEELVRPEGMKAGVEIKEIRFGEPAIPPELLVARQREQLAQQLKKAFTEERTAQFERISTEQAKATANQQPKLVEAEIELKRSEQFAMSKKNEGQGERDKLYLIAEGQKAQAQVLGENRVVELRKFELVADRIFTFFEKNPEVLSKALANAHKFVPERVFSLGGSGNSAMGAAGILGDLLGGNSDSSPKNQPEKAGK